MSAACATTSFELDRLALELIVGQRLLEAGVGEVVVRLVAEPALRDDQRDGLFSRARRHDRAKAQSEGRNCAQYSNSLHGSSPLPLAGQSLRVCFGASRRISA